MTLWKHRFVNRPHAGAVPPSNPYMDRRRARPRPASAVSRRALARGPPRSPRPMRRSPADGDRGPGRARRGRAGRGRSSFEATEPVEIADDADVFSVDEPEIELEADAGDEPVEPVEHERTGFFRRRKPVVAEPETEELDAAVEEHDEVAEPRHGASSRSPTRVLVRGADEPAEEEVVATKRGRLQAPQDRRGREHRRDGARGHLGRRGGRRRQKTIRGTSRPSSSRSRRSRRSPHRPRIVEARAEEPEKRGLFRRRKSAPVEEPVAEDADAESFDGRRGRTGAPRYPATSRSRTSRPSRPSPRPIRTSTARTRARPTTRRSSRARRGFRRGRARARRGRLDGRRRRRLLGAVRARVRARSLRGCRARRDRGLCIRGRGSRCSADDVELDDADAVEDSASEVEVAVDRAAGRIDGRRRRSVDDLP